VVLDDVGEDLRSLALLPLLRPDVVKLDLVRLRRLPECEVATVVGAVGAEAERTGAVVAAEGIETRADAATARAFGARVGQGWHYGRPRAAPVAAAGGDAGIDASAAAPAVAFTPFQIVRAKRPPRRAGPDVLLSVSRTLESSALEGAAPAVVLSAFGHEALFRGATRAMYAQLAACGSFVAVAGVGMSPWPAPGVRGTRLRARDPLRDEWVVAVIGPHFCGALAARAAAGAEESFDYTVTYERAAVVAVARTFMARVVAD
jgi:EAL domain/Sensory domain in DIguanylate Cyclases and Two-component system